MRFQKTTEYAIRVMTFLAMHRQERFSVSTLHKKLRIPYKYLARLMSKLSQAGLVEVQQGKNGGFSISKNLENIYLYQIVGVVEGLEDYERCVLGFPECSSENPCPLHHLWLDRLQSIKDLLYNTTLADLLQRETMKV